MFFTCANYMLFALIESPFLSFRMSQSAMINVLFISGFTLVLFRKTGILNTDIIILQYIKYINFNKICVYM